MKNPADLDDDSAAVLVGLDVVEMAQAGEGTPMAVTKKAKIADKVAAITLAMRHLGALQDKVDLTSKGETINSGVLVVPGVMSEEEWESASGV